MGNRWIVIGTSMLLIIVLEIHGCWSINSEGLALLQFRANVASFSSGALTDWLPDDFDPCFWSGVKCVDSKVVMLNLTGRGLEGALAPDIGNLSHLRVLDLSKNRFFGPIPPQLGQLTKLETLDLRDNEFTGRIPADLRGLKSLRHLLLSNNRFQGCIPVDIKKLALLKDTQFDDILTTTAKNGCMNRKFGHWYVFSCFHFPIYLTVLHSHEIQTNNNVRRVLAEQSSSNLIALPPSDAGAPAPSESEESLPSRSSGSFPAVPNAKNLSPSAGVDNNTPPETASPRATSQTNDDSKGSSEKTEHSTKVIIGVSCAAVLLVLVLGLFVVFRSRAARTIGPWKSGLSGQLQKAFITGVPKLNRAELETACEDFSNIIRVHEGVATLYKGTLSSGVEIAVVSTAVGSIHEWSKRAELAFRKKIDTLSRVNHKNFVNLIGYCEENEPFTRMMVFEYAPNGTLFEHLHVKDLEHLDWNARMRIVMGAAYCLQYMHELNPPVAHINLTSKDIFLTDDYAAKIADVGFWLELVVKSKNKGESDSEHSELPPLADVETNVHSFGVLLLEIVSGMLPHSPEKGNLTNWAAQYLPDKKTFDKMVDSTLKSFKENELETVCEVIQCCIHHDPRKRPSMKEIIHKLREAIDVSPEAAIPKLSPLWWAELEILSAEAA
ncbi:Leucine-rich repeat protein kinase family protein [Striga hermonthica]|uniref:Leucine-rich repeat protein kinase family protein n=1 Tax=Striga hermonthica TaxID=68872 RepID=A0A9N7MY30_STRHE|nr:Leucine-rich repeat protein kinase family protein [Striga hermonthica]